jgi:hypothetical protein
VRARHDRAPLPLRAVSNFAEAEARPRAKARTLPRFKTRQLGIYEVTPA